ncbi:hypothetical protein C8F04DRAFT_1253042 [Mycena alexandri]|uniref:Uncharacterized protein n=1 Tax=Mycena alexandri TaxID=1745969 RepID=A0AAD6T978_9AGAR|nr:hypothetical protein C8F04DRAFT_1253042 [Mycena alexandri]
MSTAAGSVFPDELYVEVASHATASTAAASRFSRPVARHLYFRIALSSSAAPLFFLTLRLKPALGQLVFFLHFLSTTSSGRHESDDFETAIASLTDVNTLHIMCPIDVDVLLTKFSSLLKVFTCRIPVCDSMLIVGAAVDHIRIRYTQFDLQHMVYLPLIFLELSDSKVTHLDVSVTQLLQGPQDALCLHLPALYRLIVRADGSWLTLGQYTTGTTHLVQRFTTLPLLRRLVVLTAFGAREANIFYQALRNHCCSPRFRYFWFHTSSSCFHRPDICLGGSAPIVIPACQCLRHSIYDW